MKNEIEPKEKEDWIKETREELQRQGLRGTQKEIAKALGIVQSWVSKYDSTPVQPHTKNTDEKLSQRDNFFGYNVWGFKDEIRREFDYFTFLLSKHTGIPKEDALFLIVATVIPHTILTKKKGYSNAEALELWKCEVRNKLCGDNTFYLFQQFLDRIGAGYFDKGVS